MLPGYIHKLIEEGEGQHLDFKHSIADSFKIARSLVSFANAGGGTLLVGVDDKRRVVGVDENEEVYMLEIAARNYSKPPVEIQCKRHQSEKGKTVLECIVADGQSRPYRCKQLDGSWKAFYRDDDECRLASAVRYRMMKLSSSGVPRKIYSEEEDKVIRVQAIIRD